VRGEKVWFAVGLALLLLGSWLRRHCFKMLGRYFTANVKVADGQTVIQEGAYHWIRHPSYTGGMLMYLGTGLALTNWLSTLVIVCLGGLGYAYRVRVEERALAATLGERYKDYMRRTKRFVPFVF
jgi:protein-S-isoprenylcysteine O-methyltransferase Ste14